MYWCRIESILCPFSTSSFVHLTCDSGKDSKRFSWCYWTWWLWGTCSISACMGCFQIMAVALWEHTVDTPLSSMMKENNSRTNGANELREVCCVSSAVFRWSLLFTMYCERLWVQLCWHMYNRAVPLCTVNLNDLHATLDCKKKEKKKRGNRQCR